MIRFAVAMALAVLLAIPACVRADEAAAVQHLEKLGAAIVRDDTLPGKPIVAVTLTGPTVTDAGLKELKECKNLQTLYLRSTQVTDAGLKELSACGNLQTLGLVEARLTDAGMKE